jgi:hypothetical protein
MKGWIENEQNWTQLAECYKLCVYVCRAVWEHQREVLIHFSPVFVEQQVRG